MINKIYSEMLNLYLNKNLKMKLEEILFPMAYTEELRKNINTKMHGDVDSTNKIQHNVAYILNKIRTMSKDVIESDASAFAIFRLKYFYEDFDKLLNSCINEIYNDYEQLQICKFFKSFISMAEPSYELISIFFYDDSITILDDNQEDITEEFMPKGKDIDKYNLEDLMNELLAKVPAKIKCTGLDNIKNKEFKNSFKLIFEDRLEYLE
jgi:hypothetical protein